MTHFEFLSVFVSIVLAFGVSDILSSWGEQIRMRKQIRHYWLHVVWTILALLLLIQAWWGLSQLQDRTDWLFTDNLILIFPNLILALIAFVLTPSVKDGDADIKRYYYDNSPWIFGLGAAYIVGVVINTKNALGTPFLDPRNAIRVSAMLLMIVLAV
jgi:uncharacterized membrane protein